MSLTITPKYVPTIGKLKEIGLTHRVDSAGPQSGNTYVGYINSSDVFHATLMVAKWADGAIQVAKKNARQSYLFWEFKGFGVLEDEEHFMRLVNGPQPSRITM